MVFYTDASWPFWLKALVTAAAAAVVAAMGWRYYRNFWKR